jgi:SAM-dependent methyltransferase
MTCLNRLLAFNSSRRRLLQENAAFARMVPANSLVLDAGAGDCPYQNLFSHARYESADFEKVDKKYGKTTYVCDLRKIPVEDGRFDFIIFNQVMEHLPEPCLVLKELCRVLKPGGEMMYSAPLFYEEHEQPYDFFRYTQFGVRHLLTSAGFSIKRLEWLEGYFGTVAYQFNCMARFLPVRPGQFHNVAGWGLAPLTGALKVQCACLSYVFHRLELWMKIDWTGHPKNYVAVAVKPLP